MLKSNRGVFCYDKCYLLTGFTHITVNAGGIFTADTIKLREEHEGRVKLQGKVTANGQTQNCEVTLKTVHGDEIAKYTTAENGKYAFAEVKDGAYIIIAITESDGMGYTVITVSEGIIYGELDIRVFKDGKINSKDSYYLILILVNGYSYID